MVLEKKLFEVVYICYQHCSPEGTKIATMAAVSLSLFLMFQNGHFTDMQISGSRHFVENAVRRND